MRARPLIAWTSPLLALGALSACAARTTRAPLAPPVVATLPTPRPPAGAAPGLRLPPRLAYGSFATPNRDLSGAGTIWHLRIALNVAALGCRDADLERSYNALLREWRAPFAAAHRALADEYRRRHGAAWQAAFDGEMTRLYNYFAQPPVGADLCAAARDVLPRLAAGAAIEPAAAPALAAIDGAYQRFFVRYARWQAESVAGMPERPMLTVDPALFVADAAVVAAR